MQDEWHVYPVGDYDVATSLAIDDFLFRKAVEEEHQSLRIYGFDPPSLIMGRATPWEDIKTANGYQVGRRRSGGSTILCGSLADDEDPNTVAYTVARPAGDGRGFEELFGDYIVRALSSVGIDEDLLEIPEEYSYHVALEGKDIAGNALFKGARSSSGKETQARPQILQGVIPIEGWDAEQVDEAIRLRQYREELEKEAIDDLPAVEEYLDEHPVQAVRERVIDELIEAFAGGEAIWESLDEDVWSEVRAIRDDRYSRRTWIEEGRIGNEEGEGNGLSIGEVDSGDRRGFCMLGLDENSFY